MSVVMAQVARITSSDYIDVNLYNLNLTIIKQLNGFNFLTLTMTVCVPFQIWPFPFKHAITKLTGYIVGL
jgi:hypothetical protein